MVFILFSTLFISVTIMIMASIIFKGFKKDQIILYMFYIMLMIIWFCLGINYIEKKDDIFDMAITQIESKNIDSALLDINETIKDKEKSDVEK